MTFTNFGLKKFLNDKLKELNFEAPTPIQMQVIPLLQKHRNVIAQAPTGTGKSHAFLLPLINNLDSQKTNEVQLIIFTPTQELSQQLFANVKFLIGETEFKAELYTKNNQTGNTKIKTQPTIIIGTPQRLRYLYESQEIRLTTARALVIDEVDMIFEQGFIEELDFLMTKMRNDVQTAFFSATINQQLKHYLKKYSKNSFWLEIKKQNKSLITHYYLDLGTNSFFATLNGLLKNLNPYLALIFVNNKNEIKTIKSNLEALNIGAIGELHGGLEARTRSQIMKRIRQGDFKYVIVSDVASRGLDIPGISHVISLGLPKNLEFYWHRSGRTGRNQSFGESYLLANTNDLKGIKILEKKGINFIPLKLTTENHLIRKKNRFEPRTSSIAPDHELNKLIGSFAQNKVKPNYKKKRKQAIEQLTKQRKRREVIASMRENKKNKYKKRRSLLFTK